MDERDERKRTSDDASKRTWTTSKPGSPSCSGMSVEDTCLLTTRCPVFRRRDSHLGFRMELETLAGHAKGKGMAEVGADVKRAHHAPLDGVLGAAIEFGGQGAAVAQFAEAEGF